MSTKMRPLLFMSANQREKLECPRLVLESSFVDDGSPETLVMVYRVGPFPGTRRTNMSVVKFLADEFAIPNAENLQLGTHRYYQEYEGAGEGIRDEMDGRFQEDISDPPVRASGLWGLAKSFSAQATMGVKDQWLFCTSVVPTWARGLGLRRLGNRLGYECGTQILDPAAFAQELGEAFAAHTSWHDVRLSAQRKALGLLASMGDIERTVFVYHGPVCYPSDAAKVVNSFPELHRPAIAPFQKRPDSGWQQEYRFTVRFLGEPQAKTLLLPITTEFRALASVVWEEGATREAVSRSWQAGEPCRMIGKVPPQP